MLDVLDLTVACCEKQGATMIFFPPGRLVRTSVSSYTRKISVNATIKYSVMEQIVQLITTMMTLRVTSEK